MPAARCVHGKGGYVVQISARAHLGPLLGRTSSTIRRVNVGYYYYDALQVDVGRLCCLYDGCLKTLDG